MIGQLNIWIEGRNEGNDRIDALKVVYYRWTKVLLSNTVNLLQCLSPFVTWVGAALMTAGTFFPACIALIYKWEPLGFFEALLV